MNKNIMGIGQGSWREKKDTWKILPGESSGHPNLTSSRCSEGDNSNLELQIEN